MDTIKETPVSETIDNQEHSEPIAEISPEVPTHEQPEKSEKKKYLVCGITFRTSPKTYFFAPGDLTLKIGDAVIVETSRGLEFGKVKLTNHAVSEDKVVLPLREVLRIATPSDVKHYEENRILEKKALKACKETILQHKLEMNLVDAAYTFDNKKLSFYFTSESRVDFRDLVKDLASIFKVRIDLRQIGIRDEARMIGGLGVCGRPFCCCGFLSDFAQVSIKMAKEQTFSLNSSKISGSCGRLMCCLRYEHSTYEEAIRALPPVGSVVETPLGVGTVTELKPLAEAVAVRLDNSEDPPKTHPISDIKILRYKTKGDGGEKPLGGKKQKKEKKPPQKNDEKREKEKNTAK